MDDVSAEIEAELESHFVGTVQLLVRRGWTEKEARAEARRRFGDVDRYRADLRRIDRRHVRRRRWSSAGRTLVDTAASAVRGLSRAPAFSLAVIITLALGIGANAAIFRVADRLLLSPPEHVENPATLRLLSHTNVRDDGDSSVLTAFSWAEVEGLRAAGLPARIASGVHSLPETLGEGDGAIRARALRVDRHWFPLIGVEPWLGRGFSADDHRADAPPVTLLAHHLWVSHFGADPAVVGRVIRVRNLHYEVVGVLPDGFVGADAPAVDLWLPLEVSAPDVWGEGWKALDNLLAFRIYARLDDPSAESTLEEAATTVLAGVREAGYVLTSTLASVDAWGLVPGEGPHPNAMIRVSRWLAAVAALVLLVACANVANLFLAHGERMRHEVTLRRALGAGRSRLVGELLLRSLLLALLGGAAALAMAGVLGGALDRIFLEGIDLGGRVRVGRLTTFVGLASVLAAVLAGLIPALVGPRGTLRGALDRRSRSSTGGTTLRRGLVGVQAALSAVLLIGALLFVSSLRTAVNLDFGFDPDRVAAVLLEPESEADLSRADLLRQGREALTALPGVEGVTETVAVPFMIIYGTRARLPGHALDDPDFEDGRVIQVNAVGADYFRTMGTRVVEGRGIEASDLQPGAEPVLVVGESVAAELWPGRSAVGACLIVGREETPCARVVGVAQEHAGSQGRLERFTPGSPAPGGWVPLPVVNRTPQALLVRLAEGDPGALDSVRRAMLGIPGVRFAEISPLSGWVDRETRSWRLGATVFTLFGLIALCIAILGLYGVLSYEVARRRRELGVRLALGADDRRLAVAVLIPALATVATGLAVALPTAAFLAARMENLLYHVSPHSPAIFATTAAVLLAGALLSALIPAWRATRVDPREALSGE